MIFFFGEMKLLLMNLPWLVLDDMKKDHGLVGINHHIYLFYDFNYPKLNLTDPSDGKIKLKEFSLNYNYLY